MGYPVSYVLVPGHGTTDLLDPNDLPRKRAGFADYQLWLYSLHAAASRGRDVS